jgi:hypothetical protein
MIFFRKMNNILEIFGGKDNLVIMCDAFDIEHEEDISVSFSVQSIRADCRTYRFKVTKAFTFPLPTPLFHIEILDTLEGERRSFVWLLPGTVKDTLYALTGLSLDF